MGIPQDWDWLLVPSGSSWYHRGMAAVEARLGDMGDVPCSWCGAAVGERCVTKSGLPYKQEFRSHHRAREAPFFELLAVQRREREARDLEHFRQLEARGRG